MIVIRTNLIMFSYQQSKRKLFWKKYRNKYWNFKVKNKSFFRFPSFTLISSFWHLTRMRPGCSNGLRLWHIYESEVNILWYVVLKSTSYKETNIMIMNIAKQRIFAWLTFLKFCFWVALALLITSSTIHINEHVILKYNKLILKTFIFEFPSSQLHLCHELVCRVNRVTWE